MKSLESICPIISFFLFQIVNKILYFLRISFSNTFFKIVIDIFIPIILFIPGNVDFTFILFLFQNIVVSITMIATFECVRVGQTKSLVENNPTTTLLIHILISIFGLHMFSRKVALLKLEVKTVLANYFRE